MIIPFAHRLHLGGLRFLALRVIGALALAPVVMLFIHALLLWSPGNYFDTLGNSARLSPQTVDLLKRQFHLENEDLFPRYWSWSVQAAQGNFGYSFRYDAPVARLLWDRLPTTALLIGMALVLSFGVSVSSGVWAAARPGKICDRVTLALSTLGLATPTFFEARIIFRHIAPNVAPVMFATAASNITLFLFGESALSFLGFGVAEPEPSLGNLLTAAMNIVSVTEFPWILSPGIALFLMILGWRLIAESLADTQL